MIFRKLIIINTCLLFFLPYLSYADELKKAYIEWLPVEGASGYYVELKTSEGKVLFRKQSAQNRLEIIVPYGNYQFRVAIINKFQKISKWSKWFDLTIAKPLPPEFISITPSKILLNAGKETFLIKGKNFNPKTTVILRKDNIDLSLDNYKFVDENTLSFELEKSLAKAGSYDLIIKNPGDLEFLQKNCILITLSLVPEIIKIIPDSIDKESKKNKISIIGRNFEKETLISFKLNKEDLPVEKIEYINPEKINVELNADRADAGRYDLIAINPGVSPVIKKDYLTLLSFNKQVLLYQILGFEYGYFSQYPGNVSGYSGYTGGSLFYENHSLNKIFKFIPREKKYSGLFLGAKISFYYFLNPESNFGNSQMIQGAVYSGYDFNLSFIKFIPCSLSPYLGYKHYYRKHTYKGEEFVSFRPIAAAGLSMNFFPFKAVSFGIGFEYSYIFDVSPVHSTGFFLRTGYRL